MCSQYTIKTTSTELVNEFGIETSNSFEEINERIFPKRPAPVIVSDNGLKIVGMQFSLIPSWSKEPKVKFATHNARLETISEKPTWKIPFKERHCVVPMTGFFESVYEGPFAGNVIQFVPRSDKILFAAGIFDIWNADASIKPIYSFSILTSNPSQFIEENGHDRTPIFLNYTNAKTWLSLLNDVNAMTDFLNTKYVHPDFDIQIDRPLKAGWDKQK